MTTGSSCSRAIAASCNAVAIPPTRRWLLRRARPSRWPFVGRICARLFFDIARGGDAPIASEALERIAALYAIEKMIWGMSAEDRHRVRQDQNKPLVASLKTWHEQQVARVSSKQRLPRRSAMA
jgi:Transposase IS66 family